ncbi:unnamed protein product [Rhizophagus irregularis]|nr:unnamed protein product [Rhizophagus irregularis]
MEQSHKSDRSGRSYTRSHTKSRRTSRSQTKSHHRTGRSRTRSHTKSRRTSRSRTRSHHRTGRSRTRSNTKSRTQSHTNERENGPFHLVLPPELEHAYEIGKLHSNQLHSVLCNIFMYNDETTTILSSIC